MPPLYKMVIAPPAPPYGPPQTVNLHPDPHPEVTTVDGYVRPEDYQVGWAACHDNIGGSFDDIGPLEGMQFLCHTTDNYWRILLRSILLFDASSIPAGSLIVSAHLYLHGYAKVNTGTWTLALNVFESFPNANTSLEKFDYQHLYDVPFSTKISYAAWDENGWNIFILNPTGLLKIIPQTIIKLGLREANYDAPDINPGWEAGKQAWIYCDSADAGLAKSPYLAVTYRPLL